MPTILEITNQALQRVGAEAQAATTDDTEAANAAEAAWPFVRQSVLRDHSWNVATRRDRRVIEYGTPINDFELAFQMPADCLRVLEVDTEYQWRVEDRWILVDGVSAPVVESGKAITAATAANPVFVTILSHGYAVGDQIYFRSSDQTELNDRVFRISGVTTNSFQLDTEDGTGRTPGTSGQAQKVTSGGLFMRYIRDLTTDLELAKIDALLAEAFVLRLATAVVERITDSTTKRQSLLAEYEAVVRLAKKRDGEESSVAEFEEDLWITARSR